MKIKKISIKNFRSYYGDIHIEFNDGLVLFIGDNGDGKTTFFEALEWLFDTSTQNKSESFISKKRISELSEFQADEVKVSMIFEHYGENIVEKSFLFEKNKAGEIMTKDFKFKGWQNNGTERTQICGGDLLERYFETAIRQYCMFKGEDNLNVFNNNNALNYLVETFSNIRQFAPFYTGEDTNPGFTDYAEKESYKAYRRAMKADNKNEKQEKALSSKLDFFRRELNRVKQSLSTKTNEAELYTNKLNEIENSKEASSLLKNINERLQTLNQKKINAESRIREDYTIRLLDEMWILCGFPEIFEEYQQKIHIFSKEKRHLEDEEKKQKAKQEAYQEIGESIKDKNFIPLSIYIPDENTMKEMIEDEVCKVCGREARKGTEAYNFMVTKLEELLKSRQPKEEKQEKLLFENNFSDELTRKSIQLEQDKKSINNLANTIKEDIDFNEKRKQEAKKIQNSIEEEEDNKKRLLAQHNTFTEEQLKNAYENISNWFNGKGKAEKEIIILEQEKEKFEKQLVETQKEYDSLAKGSVASSYCKVYTAFNKIQNAFKYAKEKNTQDFLLELEKKANTYLEKLNIDGFFGIIRIIKTPDGSATIKLQDKNNVPITNPNQALKTTMYMSVLFAVSELTAIKRENDYPLIFDAPTSSFAPQKENDFFNVISNINKQCIIFSKSFLTENGTLDEAKIDSLSCNIYRMEKKRPFDDRDLSTIQTVVTKIK